MRPSAPRSISTSRCKIGQVFKWLNVVKTETCSLCGTRQRYRRIGFKTCIREPRSAVTLRWGRLLLVELGRNVRETCRQAWVLPSSAQEGLPCSASAPAHQRGGWFLLERKHRWPGRGRGRETPYNVRDRPDTSHLPREFWMLPLTLTNHNLKWHGNI